MAPRETYDPEDIESLLSERGFDELLAEERAFVLRHLSDRHEYERMRALLLRVREDESGAASAVVEPDAAVRENLLHVFRQQQVPAWRIWLNTVKGFLWPEQVSAFWRPALAFGSLALVVALSVIGWQRVSSPADELAQVEEKHTPAPTEPPGVSTEAKELAPSVLREEEPASRTSGDITEPRSAWQPMVDLQEQGAEAAESVAETPPPQVDQVQHTAALDISSDAATGSAASVVSMEKAEGDDGAVNYVEREELLRNETIANQTGHVAMEQVVLAEVSKSKASRAKDKKALADMDVDTRSIAQDGQLLELLNAAW